MGKVIILPYLVDHLSDSANLGGNAIQERSIARIIRVAIRAGEKGLYYGSKFSWPIYALNGKKLVWPKSGECVHVDNNGDIDYKDDTLEVESCVAC